MKFELLNQSGIKKLKFRERTYLETMTTMMITDMAKKKDDHDDHDHDKAKKEDHDDHGHDDHGHGHGEFDPHLARSANAKTIVKKGYKQLSKLDKENSSNVVKTRHFKRVESND